MLILIWGTRSNPLCRGYSRPHIGPEVLGKVGGFGGLFALDVRKYRQPVLVSSVDGVGTKLKLAFALDRHDTIGQDLVNHCVNDIAVLGAEPLSSWITLAPANWSRESSRTSSRASPKPARRTAAP